MWKCLSFQNLFCWVSTGNFWSRNFLFLGRVGLESWPGECARWIHFQLLLLHHTSINKILVHPVFFFHMLFPYINPQISAENIAAERKRKFTKKDTKAVGCHYRNLQLFKIYYCNYQMWSKYPTNENTFSKKKNIF